MNKQTAFSLATRHFMENTIVRQNPTGYFTRLNGGTREILNNSKNESRIIKRLIYVLEPMMLQKMLASITSITNSAAS